MKKHHILMLLFLSALLLLTACSNTQKGASAWQAPEKKPAAVKIVSAKSGKETPIPNALPGAYGRHTVYVTDDGDAHLYVRYANHADGGQPRAYEIVRAKDDISKAEPLVTVQRAHHVIADANHVAICGDTLIWLETELTPNGVLGHDWSLWCADRNGENIRLLDEDAGVDLKKGRFTHSVPYRFSAAGDVVVYTTFTEKDGTPARIVRMTNLKTGEHKDLATETDYQTYWFSTPDTDGTNVVWSKSQSPDGRMEKGTSYLYNIEREKTTQLENSDTLIQPRISGNHLIVRHLPKGERLAVRHDKTVGSEFWHYDLDTGNWTWSLSGKQAPLAARRLVDFESPHLEGDWLLVRATGARTMSLSLNMSKGILYVVDDYGGTIAHGWIPGDKPKLLLERQKDGLRSLSAYELPKKPAKKAKDNSSTHAQEKTKNRSEDADATEISETSGIPAHNKTDSAKTTPVDTSEGDNTPSSEHSTPTA